MVHLELRARVKNRSAAEVFPILSDLEKYPSVVDAVHSLTVGEKDGQATSNWEVDFRGGVMRWQQEDVFLPEEHAFRFRQLDGDLDSFSGDWSVTDEEGGCRVEFRADFDLGIPGLAETLEPIAEAALRENILGIVTGLLGAEVIE
ncbi:MAG TPA: SRPBCC family protein [Dehalococcoidia bacterium]|nr:SRPBCC family protein [Dehalococcoidia bacterium]